MKKLVTAAALIFTLATPAKAQETRLNPNLICDLLIRNSNLILNAQGVTDLSSIGIEPVSVAENAVDNNPNTADVMYSQVARNDGSTPTAIYDWRIEHTIFWAHEDLETAISSQAAFDREIFEGTITQMSQCFSRLGTHSFHVNGQMHEQTTFTFFNNGQEFLASIFKQVPPSYQISDGRESIDGFYVNILHIGIDTYNGR